MSIQWRAAEEAQNGHRSNQQPSNRQGTKWCSVSRKPRRQRALHASRAAESTLVRKHGQPTNRAPRPAAEKPVSSMRTKLTLKQACFQGYPESTVYVQIPVGSRNSASRNAYHTSLRPSSLFEPRHPSLKVVRKQSPCGGYRQRVRQAQHTKGVWIADGGNAWHPKVGKRTRRPRTITRQRSEEHPPARVHT